MPDFIRGQGIYLEVTVKNRNGELVTPNTVTLTVRKANDVTTQPTVSNSSTGVYYAVVTLASDDPLGTWLYQWKTTNPAAVAEGSFTVIASRVA
jgi:uncharacterized protein YfaS (alpha-2-macroglobulin family)